MRKTLLAALSAAALLPILSATPAHAEDDHSGEWWINAGGISHHFNRSMDFNERNWGAGVEYVLSNDVSLVAGEYRNSVRTTTRYLGASYTPLSFGPARFGIVAGAADGYRMMRDGGFFPIISPVINIEGKRFGANLLVIPSVASNVRSALAIQFKIRFGR